MVAVAGHASGPALPTSTRGQAWRASAGPCGPRGSPVVSDRWRSSELGLGAANRAAGADRAGLAAGELAERGGEQVGGAVDGGGEIAVRVAERGGDLVVGPAGEQFGAVTGGGDPCAAAGA